MRAYEYSALPDGHIRLLAVQNRGEAFGRTWSLELCTFDLLHAPPWKALSYVWGSPSNDERYRMHVCDYDRNPAGNLDHATTGWMQLTPNLHEGLPHVWKLNKIIDKGYSTYFWVDAICIDQRNDEEKGRVIKQMHEYYTRAEEVLIWFGPAADDSDRVLEPFREIYAEARKELYVKPDLWGHPLEPIRHSAGGSLDPKALSWSTSRSHIEVDPHELRAFWTKLFRNGRALHHEFAWPRSDDPVWSGVEAICERDWLHRVWTFQEGDLARRATIICGNSSIDLTVFRELLGHWPSEAWGEDLLPHTQIQNSKPNGLMRFRNARLSTPRIRGVEVWARMHAPRSRQGYSWYDFWILMKAMRLRQCTLEEDRIYGLLALGDESIRTRVPVLYSKSETIALQLYRLVNYLYLEEASIPREGCRDHALEQVLDEAVGQNARAGLPTWCVDWSQPTHHPKGRPYTANNSAILKTGWRNFGYTKVSDTSVLEVRGIEACRVASTCVDWQQWSSLMSWIKSLATSNVPAESDQYLRPIYLEACRALYQISHHTDIRTAREIEIHEQLFQLRDAPSSSLEEYAHVIQQILELPKCVDDSSHALLYLDDGGPAIGPRSTCVGDLLVVICGTGGAYILRPDGDEHENGYVPVTFVGPLSVEKLRGDVGYLNHGDSPPDRKYRNDEEVLEVLKPRTRIFSIR